MAKIIGMIVPPAAGDVPPEPPVLYPDLTFIAEGLALPKLTPEGYDAVIADTAGLAKKLKDRGADAISLMGTSLSFYRGPAGNRQVIEAMRAATDLPVTTMTNAVLEALDALGAKRLAVATAYVGAVNDALTRYLDQSGYETLSLEPLNLSNVEDILAVDEPTLVALGQRALAAAPDADALFISCGGLKTINVAPPLEAMFDVPVITSATAGAWGAARLAGHSGRSPGHGRLFTL
ncbi:MAG: hypothetical protein AcusKO_24820 [Acuticoccus sp.]